MYYTLYTVV